MKNVIGIAAILGAAAVVTGLVLYLAGGPTRAKHARKAPAAPLDEQPTQVGETVRAELQRAVLTQAAARPIEHDAKAEVPDPSPDQEPESSGAVDGDEQRARRRAEMRAGLERHFQQQSGGGDWARDTTMKINNALVGLMKPPDSVLSSVDCRGTICRIEVGTSDESHYDQAFQSVVQARWSFGTGPFFLTRNETHGTTKGLVMFLARNGEALPGVAAALPPESADAQAAAAP